jgi:fatty-acyl-CoA synthase
LNKVGCKAIILSSSFKTQDYAAMLLEVCPELKDCKPGELNSERLPELKSAILISDTKPAE